MSQQSKTSCGSVGSLQTAISEMTEWLWSDEAAGSCVQHACLFLRISAPLTFLVCEFPQWDVDCRSFSPAQHAPQLKPRGRERHQSPSWGSWPHITVAHLSEPLTVFTQADVPASPDPVLASAAKAQAQYFQPTPGSSMTAVKWGRSTPGSSLAYGRKRNYVPEQGRYPVSRDYSRARWRMETLWAVYRPYRQCLKWNLL